jgi:glycosyltransferase involved in cell wall biosynthesis
MTSSLEACPNIALEAMSHGCVCICAKNPPLPEFFADCAIYYQSQDALGLADAINSTVKWGDVKKLEISKKALERAAGFSWDKTGASLIDELKNAAKRNSIT